MAFTYTQLLEGASPIRGGRYAGMEIIKIGIDGAGLNNLVSTNLASVVWATLNIYGQNQTSNFVKSISSNGMVAIDLGGACSGSLMVVGN